MEYSKVSGIGGMLVGVIVSVSIDAAGWFGIVGLVDVDSRHGVTGGPSRLVFIPGFFICRCLHNRKEV